MRGPAWARAGRTEPVACSIDEMDELITDICNIISDGMMELTRRAERRREELMVQTCPGVPPRMLPENMADLHKICEYVIARNQAFAILDAMSKLARHSAEPLAGSKGILLRTACGSGLVPSEGSRGACRFLSTLDRCERARPPSDSTLVPPL